MNTIKIMQPVAGINSPTDKLFVDDTSTIDDMKRDCPRFFEHHHGSNYNYTVHRGCLISRYTLNLRKPERRTAIYLFTTVEGKRRMVHIPTSGRVESVDQGKRLIDRVLDTGVLEPKFWLRD